MNSRNGEWITKTISYRLQFIDSAKFMTSSLSNFINNLAEEIHITKFKYGHYNDKCETFEMKYKDFECYLEILSFKNDLIE